jgi:hypothetical protein
MGHNKNRVIFLLLLALTDVDNSPFIGHFPVKQEADTFTSFFSPIIIQMLTIFRFSRTTQLHEISIGEILLFTVTGVVS